MALAYDSEEAFRAEAERLAAAGEANARPPSRRPPRPTAAATTQRRARPRAGLRAAALHAAELQPYGPSAVKVALAYGSEEAFCAEAERLAAAVDGHANLVQAKATALEPGTRRLAIVMQRWQASLTAVLRCGSRNNIDRPVLDALERETVAFQLATGLALPTCCTETS